MTNKSTQVGVVGAGTMGAGIAQVFAQKGFLVTLCDTAPSQLEKALAHIERNLRRDMEKQKIAPAQLDQTLQRIRTESQLGGLSEVSLVVEAVSEDFEVKASVFEQLDRVCEDSAILASNTSSISVTRLGAKTRLPARVIGMHFMNPVPAMKLVEIIRGMRTSQRTFDTIQDFVTRLDKVPVEVNDSPGFVSNRILMPMINEAIFCLFEGVGSPEAIDSVMKLGMNHPMGPLALADLIGLDVCLNIMDTLYEGFSDPKYRPCPLLRKMVAAGRLGCKNGEGFYNYAQ